MCFGKSSARIKSTDERNLYMIMKGGTVPEQFTGIFTFFYSGEGRLVEFIRIM